jgi:hypothetical protein
MTTHLRAARASLAAALLVLVAAPTAQAAARVPVARVLERALKLLGALPTVPIRLIDPELAPDAEAIRRVDAFLVREPDGRVRQVIYLNSRSSVMENALGGKDIDIAILAAVIWHELEHLRGAGERGARRAERECFQRLMFAGHVPVDAGLAYLADLEQHHQLREAR